MVDEGEHAFGAGEEFTDFGDAKSFLWLGMSRIQSWRHGSMFT
jgi:hypothetical protein